MSGAVDVLRFLLSFAFVIALMWGAARIMRKQVAGRGTGALEVLARQAVGRGSAVAVVRVGEQALVVGITEQHVSLLAETDLALVESLNSAPAPAAQVAATPRGGGRRRRGATGAPSVQGTQASSVGESDTDTTPTGKTIPGTGTTALHGSILAPSTWRQAVDVLRERTVRKG